MFSWKVAGAAALMILGIAAAVGVTYGSLLALKALFGPGWESTAAYFGGWGLILVIAMGFWIKPKQKSDTAP